MLRKKKFWYHTQCADISDVILKFLRLGGDQVHWFCRKCNDQAMNFIKIVHELKDRNKYFELKLDEVCKKVEIMSSPIPCTPSNNDDIPTSHKVKSMVKEEVVELLKKDKRKCNVLILMLEEDRDNASNVNDESGVRSLVHDFLPAGDIEIVSAVRITGIQPAMQRSGGIVVSTLVCRSLGQWFNSHSEH